ncbi:quinone oxidoreductase family protein [Nitrincola alkalilacustris]|uniref:quinone oxidoreductase family protein n=1 Tax=Nitrincola alkalilacustris TaxID=1571224 RepID=UPI00124E63DE|nr:quinone oxidoreductase [Nitrincola alkalilacustris]
MPVKSYTYIFEEFGGSDVLHWKEVELPEPGVGQVLVRHEAIGVNYIDIYHRTGQFAAPLPLPSGLGMEGAGIVEAVGADVAGLMVGDRVAYAGGPPGAYSTSRLVPAARAVKIPDSIPSDIAAALLFKGLTAEYLITRCYSVQGGDTVLFHAAAGGVGQIACQWLNHLGANVIGTVSSEAKAVVAKENGCHHVINYSSENFVERVRELTGGKGVDVTYDSVGLDTFLGSVDCVKVRGTVVSFGATSGPVPLLDVSLLGAKGSIYLTRPSIAHYTAVRNELEASAAAVFDKIEKGIIRTDNISRYSLKDAAQAHRDLESRRTSGALILTP